MGNMLAGNLTPKSFAANMINGTFDFGNYLQIFNSHSPITYGDIIEFTEEIQSSKIDFDFIKIYLCNNQIDSDGILGVIKFLSIPCMKNVREIALSHNNFGIEGINSLVSFLTDNYTVENLFLCGNNIGISGVSALFSGLQTNTTLTELFIGSNNLGDDGVLVFAEFLSRNTMLNLLDLSFNEIGNIGATALALALQNNASLNILNLYGNNVEDDGAIAIAEMLQINRSLTSIDFKMNNINSVGITALGFAMQINTTLLEINLKNNCFNEYLNNNGLYNIQKGISNNLLLWENQFWSPWGSKYFQLQGVIVTALLCNQEFDSRLPDYVWKYIFSFCCPKNFNIYYSYKFYTNL